MIIEGNQTEIEAMKEFHKGNRQRGLELQEKFAAELISGGIQREGSLPL